MYHPKGEENWGSTLWSPMRPHILWMMLFFLSNFGLPMAIVNFKNKLYITLYWPN